MAYQHFYSRVPARVSMYNRSDGFDTFAHSEGLEREFIENELSVVYQNKLNKSDFGAIRRGEISPVYSQCVLRSGRLVQSCTTYLSLDYTGERSSYLTHSLIFEGEEVRHVLCGKDTLCFNPGLFVKDIGRFDVTSTSAAPNERYPSLTYSALSEDDNDILKGFSEETLKVFIYAMLLSIKSRGKGVCFRLLFPDAELSVAALNFINKVITVIPYDMRDALSFVTYVTDYSQYQGYKLRCVSERCGDASGSKNIFIDVQTGMVTGISEEELASGRTLMNFFYMLLENRQMRDEFLVYMENAARVIPSLQSPTIKVLSELVFLFCVACGHFSEDSIIPSDARVYELFCIYEKYRTMLGEEYRMEVYKCLYRYPRVHKAIPKNIFQKLTKLYTGECRSARRVAMNAVLELIHTDIMREKLFAFIRANYTDEDDDIKQTVNADLCRVFYGGFLQPQILDFFSENFNNSPETTRDLVVDKVLLTIRTASIQQKVLEFISLHYGDMSLAQRKRVYNTFFEMLPECDSLSLSLCAIVDKYVEIEDEEFRREVALRIASALEADYRRREHLLLPILASGEGFCKEQVIRLALGEWSTRKIYGEYISLISSKKIEQKTDEIVFALGSKNVSNEAKERLLGVLADIYSEGEERTTLYSWFNVDERLAGCVEKKHLDNIRKTVLYPAIEGRLFEIFNLASGSEGMRRAERYCKDRELLTETNGYKAIRTFFVLEEAIDKHAADKAFAAILELESLGAPMDKLGAYIRTVVIRTESSDIERNMLCELCASLASGVLALAEIYSSYKQIYSQLYLIERGVKADPKRAEDEGIRLSISLLWRYIPHASVLDEGRRAICREGFTQTLERFAVDYGKGADKWAEQNMSPRPEFLNECFGNAFARAKNQSGGFFSRIFGRK